MAASYGMAYQQRRVCRNGAATIIKCVETAMRVANKNGVAKAKRHHQRHGNKKAAAAALSIKMVAAA